MTNTILFYLHGESNNNKKIPKETKYTQTHRYRKQTDSCQNGGESEGWVKNLKGLGKKKEQTHRHRQQYGDHQGERRRGR